MRMHSWTCDPWKCNRNPHRVWKSSKSTLREFSRDDCPQAAAALAYYTVFSLPPLLVLILMVAGLVVNPDQIMEWLQGQVSTTAAEQVQTMVQSASQQVSGGISAALILSVVGLVFHASGATKKPEVLGAALSVLPLPKCRV